MLIKLPLDFSSAQFLAEMSRLNSMHDSFVMCLLKIPIGLHCSIEIP